MARAFVLTLIPGGSHVPLMNESSSSSRNGMGNRNSQGGNWNGGEGQGSTRRLGGNVRGLGSGKSVSMGGKFFFERFGKKG